MEKVIPRSAAITRDANMAVRNHQIFQQRQSENQVGHSSP